MPELTDLLRVAGAFPHRPKSSDFLLVRSAAGTLSVRHLTGSIMAGQQEPQMRIPAPKSKESKCNAVRTLYWPSCHDILVQASATLCSH